MLGFLLARGFGGGTELVAVSSGFLAPPFDGLSSATWPLSDSLLKVF